MRVWGLGSIFNLSFLCSFWLGGIGRASLYKGVRWVKRY